MARRHITLKDPSRFKDPAGLTWERYLAERAAIPADALAFRSVSPRYLERAVEQFANNFFPEEAATRYIATAAAHAPFEELKRCCLFQLADEQRHMEMDRDVFERGGGRDETRHISYARALVKALIDEDPSNLEVVQRWQDESLQLFVEVAKGGARREWG